ncbi:MAG: SBBP repeat-containing protein [Candidatus Zixiibacteriota bacterium]
MLKRHPLVSVVCAAVLVLWALTARAEMTVDTAWVRRYTGPSNADDWVRAVVVCEPGVAYVTGSSYRSYTDPDYATIRYYPSGDTAWVRRYDGSANGRDCGMDIAVDCPSSVYVTGYSVGSGSGDDYVTIKYDTLGNELWVSRYNGPGNGFDVAWAVELDASSNVYVTGKSEGSGTHFDYATVKYLSNGDTAWVRRYNGPGNDYDWAFVMAVDGFDNVYVTGRSYDTATSDDYATVKYDAQGNELWVRRYNGPADGWDEASGLTVDDFGNVYVTGGSSGVGTGADFATIKYYATGDTIWVRRYNGPGNDEDWAFDVDVDDHGNVFVTGRSHGGETYFDYATVKYDSLGNELWVARYSGPGAGWDGAAVIEVDGYGSVYVSGQSWVAATNEDYATVKYDSLGNEVWLIRYDGPVSGFDAGRDMKLNASGNVYVTGFSHGGVFDNYDYATVKYVQALRGDANGDRVINVADIVCLVNFLYRGGDPPITAEAGDATCDGIVDVADVVCLVNYLYRGGDPPDCP